MTPATAPIGYIVRECEHDRRTLYLGYKGEGWTCDDCGVFIPAPKMEP